MRHSKHERQTDSIRFSNFDLLRIISTIAVIFIHVNYHYFQNYAYQPSTNPVYIIESILNIITRFSVPVFVMISGAFNLRKSQNSDAGEFYRKTTWKIFIPALCAIILFLIVDEGKAIVKGTSKVSPFRGIVRGNYYNMWFLYMLAGLYLLTPLIIKIKTSISSNAYKVVSVFLMIWATVSQAFSSESVAYAIGVVFAFLGYYMLGDAILSEVNTKHRSSFYFVIAAIMYFFTFVARCLGITYYLFAAYTNFFSPFIVISSVCVFTGFKQIEIKRDFSWLSGKTLYIYVFHTITYMVIFKVLQLIGDAQGLQEIVAIALVTTVTFFISLGIAVIYDKFWRARVAWKNRWYSLKLWSKLSKL